MRTPDCTIAGIILLIAVSLLFPARASAQQDQCYSCHDLLEDAPSRAFGADVHRAAGLTCAHCHGGDASEEDMDIAMSAERGFIGVPAGTAISKRCAACHDDEETMQVFGYAGETGQLETLRGSAHARGIGENAEPLLQCTDCHGAHGIRETDDPASPVSPLRVVGLCSSCHASPEIMRRYNPSLPTDQLAKYRTSVHGERNLRSDPRTATCADCHTAHDIRPAKEATSSVHPLNIPQTCGHCHADQEYMSGYDIPTNQLALFRTSVHGTALLERRELSAPSCNDCHGNHGAAPPNVASISNVCGTCHALNAELFRDSRHAVEFERMGYPECETCHGNHGVTPATEALLRVDEGSLCGRCHSESEAPLGYRAANRMRTLLDSLMLTIDAADRAIERAEQKGMEVEDIRFALRDARQARLQSRTSVHAFELDAFREVVDPGLATARQSLSAAREANDEYYYRRHGLAVATLVITGMVVLLFFYIRRIEHRDDGNGTPADTSGGAAS